MVHLEILGPGLARVCPADFKGNRWLCVVASLLGRCSRRSRFPFVTFACHPTCARDIDVHARKGLTSHRFQFRHSHPKSIHDLLASVQFGQFCSERSSCPHNLYVAGASSILVGSFAYLLATMLPHVEHFQIYAKRVNAGELPLTPSGTAPLRNTRLATERKDHLDTANRGKQSSRRGQLKHVICQGCGAQAQYTHIPKHDNIAERKAMASYWGFPGGQGQRRMTFFQHLLAYDILRGLQWELPGYGSHGTVVSIRDIKVHLRDGTVCITRGELIKAFDNRVVGTNKIDKHQELSPVLKGLTRQEGLNVMTLITLMQLHDGHPSDADMMDLGPGPSEHAFLANGFM